MRLDMCQYGMLSHWEGKDEPLGPVMKPIGTLINSRCLQGELSLFCPGDHQHVHLVGGRASAGRPGEPKEGGLILTVHMTMRMSSVLAVSISLLCCEATELIINRRSTQSGLLKHVNKRRLGTITGGLIDYIRNGAGRERHVMHNCVATKLKSF